MINVLLYVTSISYETNPQHSYKKIPINRHSPNITKSCQIKHIILPTAVESYIIVGKAI